MRAPFPSQVSLGCRSYNLEEDSTPPALAQSPRRGHGRGGERVLLPVRPRRVLLLGPRVHEQGSEVRNDVRQVEGQRHRGVFLLPVWPTLGLLIRGQGAGDAGLAPGRGRTGKSATRGQSEEAPPQRRRPPPWGRSREAAAMTGRKGSARRKAGLCNGGEVSFMVLERLFSMPRCVSTLVAPWKPIIREIRLLCL